MPLPEFTAAYSIQTSGAALVGAASPQVPTATNTCRGPCNSFIAGPSSVWCVSQDGHWGCGHTCPVAPWWRGERAVVEVSDTGGCLKWCERCIL